MASRRQLRARPRREHVLDPDVYLMLRRIRELFSRDAPERRAAGAAIRESEERFRSLAENAADGIITIDSDDNIVFANEAMHELFGYTPAELADTPFTALMPERFRARHREGLEHYMETEERRLPWDGIELPGLHKSGREIPLEITFGKYVMDGKYYFSGIMRDLTERKKTEERLRHAKQSAEKASQAKDDFLAAMSHELRTPLNAITGYVDLLDSEVAGSLNTKQKQQLERIRAGSEQLILQINQILSLSRIEAGRVEPRLDVVDAKEVAREVSAFVAPMAERKGLELKVNLPTDAVELRTDPDRLWQILLNLVSNAVKFTDDGDIGIRVQMDGAEDVLFEVWDTGVGIAPEHMARIFERFEQVDQSTTRQWGGTGLGLSISRKLTNLLGGELTVDSEPGAGSTFTLRLARDAPSVKL